MITYVHSSKLRSGFVLVGLAVLITLLRIPSLEEPLDGDSSAVAYHARLILRGEPLYSTHHPGHHPPGGYYTYVLAFLLLGDSSISIKLLMLPWVIATAFLIYFFGRAFQREAAGIVGALIFSVLSSHIFLMGTSPKLEIFAMLPSTAAMYLAVVLFQRKKAFWGFFWVGTFCAWAFLYKPVFLAPMAAALSMIGLEVLLSRMDRKALRSGILRSLGLLAGFLTVLLVVVGSFAWEGLLGRMALIFSAGGSYVSLTNKLPWFNILLMPIYTLALNNVIILIFCFAGVLRLIKASRWDIETRINYSIPAVGIVVWFGLSMLTAGITRTDFPYYCLFAVPGISFLAGWEIAHLWSKLKESKSSGKIRVAGKIVFAAGIGLMIFYSVLIHYQFYRHYFLYRSGQESYREFLLKSNFEGESVVRGLDISNYIAECTNPDDFIYYWSDFPYVYYWADRRAPLDMIWTNQTEITGSYLRIFSPQTKYIIVGSSIYMEEPEWMQVELDKAYELETIIGDQRIYRRIEP